MNLKLYNITIALRLINMMLELELNVMNVIFLVRVELELAKENILRGLVR